MQTERVASGLRAILVTAIVLASGGAVVAVQAVRLPSRFDRLATGDPSASLDVAAQRTDELPLGDPVRAGWDEFRAENGGSWSVVLDRRSGAPLLVEGDGIPWIAGSGNSLPLGPATTL